MPDHHGPTVADPVIHRPTQAVFEVTRRTKDTETGLTYLWDNHIRYLLKECQLDALFQSDPYLNRTFVYAGDTGKLQKQFSDIKLTVLAHNGAYAQCKGSNKAYYVWVPLDALKEINP